MIDFKPEVAELKALEVILLKKLALKIVLKRLCVFLASPLTPVILAFMRSKIDGLAFFISEDKPDISDLVLAKLVAVSSTRTF